MNAEARLVAATEADEVEMAIADMAAEFFADRAPLERQHALARRIEADEVAVEPEFDLCREMGDLGFFFQAVPKSAGGLGLSTSVSSTIARAAGRQLVPGIWLDQLAAVTLLGSVGSLALESLGSGEEAVSLGVDSPNPGLIIDRKGTVSGSLAGVRFGSKVDRWAVVTEDRLLVVDPSGIELREEFDIDPLCMSVTGYFDGITPLEMFELPGGRGRALSVANGLVSAYSIGAASRCLDLAVEYVGGREQFGRPIGSFQAVKHRAANAWADLLHAGASVDFAAANEWATATTEARIAADSTYRTVAESALQMHGGIGFTSEVPVHLFLKNAQRMRTWPRPTYEMVAEIRNDLGLDDFRELVE